ncbi:MAG: hypothetical protein C4589_11195 [Peptococcaceae bacterium]|nr:MAG: hypothetical protein C4589_11195 [Peptococcaceae bacterium]
MNSLDLRKKPKYQILRSLLDKNICPTEVMRAFDIFPHEVSLGGEVAAFVYKSRTGYYHVFVNQLLSPETKREVFFHELYHIIEDMPKQTYILGMDIQHKETEKKADLFFREIMEAYAVSK